MVTTAAIIVVITLTVIVGFVYNWSYMTESALPTGIVVACTIMTWPCLSL